MIQAAWPGKQNIVEASKVSGTSKEAEIKLRNVFRSSLEELLEDYADFLRKQKHPEWPKNSREADFLAEGGLRERITRARSTQRATQKREFKP
jgi:hypothetical protein